MSTWVPLPGLLVMVSSAPVAAARLRHDPQAQVIAGHRVRVEATAVV